MNKPCLTAPLANYSFTLAEKQDWRKFYKILSFTEGKSIRGIIPKEALAFFATGAALRIENYHTVARSNNHVALNSLMAKLFLWKYMGLSAKEAMALFLGSLNGGGPGYDLEVGRWLVGTKATTDQENRHTFFRGSIQRSPTHIYTFAHLTYRNECAYVDLEGWAWKSDAKEWMRPHNGRYKVRLSTLQRTGILHSMKELKRLATQIATGGE